jgi:hypothetical protein
MDDLLLDWLLVCLVGGAFGFWRAWQLAAESERWADRILKDATDHGRELERTPEHTKVLRAETLVVGTSVWAAIAGGFAGVLMLALGVEG